MQALVNAISRRNVASGFKAMEQPASTNHIAALPGVAVLDNVNQITWAERCMPLNELESAAGKTARDGCG